MKTDTPRPILLREYRPPSYLIDTVHLDFNLHATETRVRSRLKIKPNPAVAKPGPLVLDGEGLLLEQVKLDGRALGDDCYVITADSFTLSQTPTKPFTLEITTTINPEANTALQGLYRSKGIYCTQCEAQGFRRITYFLDRPDVLARYTTRIEAGIDEAPVLLGNGNPTERGTLERGQRPLCGMEGSAPQALLPVRPRRRQPEISGLDLPHDVRPQGRPHYLRRARQGRPLPLGDGQPQALDGLGRAPLWP